MCDTCLSFKPKVVTCPLDDIVYIIRRSIRRINVFIMVMLSFLCMYLQQLLNLFVKPITYNILMNALVWARLYHISFQVLITTFSVAISATFSLVATSCIIKLYAVKPGIITPRRCLHVFFFKRVTNQACYMWRQVYAFTMG